MSTLVLAHQGLVVLHAGGADELLVLIMPFFLLAAGWLIVSQAGKQEPEPGMDGQDGEQGSFLG